ncbi:MAG: hypothetical protein J6T64_00925 [Bacteroidaceae bacterium]|nr:hypothetical protein [Bacteroidaceae bacterium]
MEKNEKNPKATRELAERLDYVLAEMKRLDWKDEASEAKYMELGQEYCDLTDLYDWYDEVFEENGKKGMKNVKGEIVIPAIYDGFGVPELYYEGYSLVAAERDGKKGLVKRDGTGTPTTEFEYHQLIRVPFSDIYATWKSEDDKHFAFMAEGKVFTPYELESISWISNGVGVVYANGKKGLVAVDLGLIYISPEYDDISGDGPGEFITFVKDGKEGRVTLDKRFVSNEAFESMTEEEQDKLLNIGFIYETD